ncbi:anti-sigma factor domain-containing protein [Guptibacillus hwajinpoensis]|uniref:anti-sigma factor domain-containing protein n=1 Tax=Guptibacillus hwajinpoensis TaxID=208199 RepID=UPI002657367A|nr:anti-sigma factor domain-containing protein [Alkalihalobacillus hemicentroti]
MKQGVIMDIRGRKAVVLTPDGEFTTINLKRNHTLTIGSEIKLTPKPLKQKKGYLTPSMPTLAGMTALLLLVVLVTGVIPVTQNNAVAAYISFDINPSIEVGVNSDLEVVHYQAWNSDGEGLNLSKETKNMPLSEFGGLLVSRLDKDGYLSDGGQLLIVASDVEKKERSEHIKDALEKAIRNIEQSEALKSQSIAITTLLNSDHSTRQQALEKGVSPGKYVTYLSALDRGVSLTLSDVRDLSVKKIEALESQNMTAHERDATNTSDEKDAADPIKSSSELEDSVVQLNDKKAASDDETGDNELILQEPAERKTEDNVKKDRSEESDSKVKDETPEINKESVKSAEKNLDDNRSNEVVNTEKKTENRVNKADKKIDKQIENSAKKQNKADKKADNKENKKENKENKKNVKIEKQQEKQKKQEEKENRKKAKEAKKQKDNEDEDDEEQDD